MNSWAGRSGSDICQTVGAMWRRQAPGRATSTAHRPHRNSVQKVGYPEKPYRATCLLDWKVKFFHQKTQASAGDWVFSEALLRLCVWVATDWRREWPVAQLATAPRTGRPLTFGLKKLIQICKVFQLSLISRRPIFCLANILYCDFCLFDEMLGSYRKPFAQVCCSSLCRLLRSNTRSTTGYSPTFKWVKIDKCG